MMNQDITSKKARLEEIKVRIGKFRKVYLAEGIEESEEQSAMDHLERKIDRALESINLMDKEIVASQTYSNNNYLEGLQDLKTRIAKFIKLYNI